MLAAQICRELHFGVIATKMQSRVPRCLFGAPNPRDTMELLQEALETERARFAKRWGVDPLAEDEDKENNIGTYTAKMNKSSPSRKRASPYAKQTSIHDYWRSRKICDPSKKSSSSAFVEVPRTQQQQQQQSSHQQPQAQPQSQTTNFIDKHQSPTN